MNWLILAVCLTLYYVTGMAYAIRMAIILMSDDETGPPLGFAVTVGFAVVTSLLWPAAFMVLVRHRRRCPHCRRDA